MRVLIDSLSAEQIKAIEWRMRPGQYSETGFLSTTERLQDVIRADDLLLREIGITHEQIADRLDRIVGQAYRIDELAMSEQSEIGLDSAADDLWDGIGAGIPVADGFAVSGRRVRGYQRCPFEDETGRPCQDHAYGDTTLTVRNTRTGKRIVFGGLLIHLIRDHHFFEGSVPYRMELREAVDVLAVQPNLDYAPEWQTETIWQACDGQGGPPDRYEWQFSSDLRYVRDYPDEIINLGDQVHLYCSQDTCVVVAYRECRVPHDLVVAGALWVDPTIHPGVWGYRRLIKKYVVP